MEQYPQVKKRTTGSEEEGCVNKDQLLHFTQIPFASQDRINNGYFMQMFLKKKKSHGK